VVEATLRLTGKGAGGLVFGNPRLTPERPYEGEAILFNTKGYVEFGTVTFNVCSPGFLLEHRVPWPVEAGRDLRVRALVKGEFAELYVEDRLVQCFGFTRPAASSIGLFAEWLAVGLRDLRVWEFDA
jgi:hypothetical protein